MKTLRFLFPSGCLRHDRVGLVYHCPSLYDGPAPGRSYRCLHCTKSSFSPIKLFVSMYSPHLRIWPLQRSNRLRILGTQQLTHEWCNDTPWLSCDRSQSHFKRWRPFLQALSSIPLYSPLPLYLEAFHSPLKALCPTNSNMPWDRMHNVPSSTTTRHTLAVIFFTYSSLAAVTFSVALDYDLPYRYKMHFFSDTSNNYAIATMGTLRTCQSECIFRELDRSLTLATSLPF